MNHLIPKDVPKCEACPLVKAINQSSKIRESLTGEKPTDFSTFTYDELVHAASELEFQYKSLKSMSSHLSSSNEILRRIIDSGTVRVNGEPLDVGENEKDKGVNPAKLPQDLKELERIAFDPKTPEKEAKRALKQLLKIRKAK